jgi:glycosyltransferase involved in cell wall biosynthesis
VADQQPTGASYFLYVGDAEPRKNLAALIEAYAVYRDSAVDPLRLVLAGSGLGSAPTVARAGVSPGVLIEGDPTRERLAELYVGAIAVVHPSLYEGFGLTALEAMSAGTPVLAARSRGLVEVCGDAARYADPRDPRSFATAMAELASASPLQRELAERGRARAAGFSWAASARAHLDAYSLALQHPQRP